MRNLAIFCDRPSNSTNELRKRLHCRRIRGNADNRLRNHVRLVVNYGSTHLAVPPGVKVLNSPEAVARAVSKRRSYEAFKASDVPTLDFTTSKSTATAWVQEGSGVLARRDGLSGGEGIVFVPKGSPSVPDADFYTRYFPKTHEFRAHVFSGRLIDLTQKRLKNGFAKARDVAPEARIVRSMENGWIHAHQFVVAQSVRDQIEQVAIRAVSALGLDFGAVDVLAKISDSASGEPDNLAVCEVNTAPGLGNEETVKAYEQAIRRDYMDHVWHTGGPVASHSVRVRKLVKVWITTRKGNRVQRDRYRWVYE